VDDFAIKYVGKQHADHLRNALLKSYELTTDWEAKLYAGMSLKWDYIRLLILGEKSITAFLPESELNMNYGRTKESLLIE
jgi:hypothetical protein